MFKRIRIVNQLEIGSIKDEVRALFTWKQNNFVIHQRLTPIKSIEINKGVSF